MASRLKNIKDRIKSLLAAQSESLAVDTFFTNPTFKLATEELPAICVYAKGETVVSIPVRSSYIEYKRSATIMVDVIVQSSTDVDDTLLDLVAKVEDILFAYDLDSEPDTWDEMTYTGMELDFFSDGDTKNAIASLSFDCVYSQAAAYPQLPDLEGFNLSHELNTENTSGSGTAESSDNIDV